MKIFFVLAAILTSTLVYSQNKLKYEMSVSIQLKNTDTLQIVPNGSAEFISKIKKNINGDTLHVKVFRMSTFAMLISWTNFHKLSSRERQRQMNGLLILHPKEIDKINYLQTYEHVWLKSKKDSATVFMQLK
jgi:hypothetical protein